MKETRILLSHGSGGDASRELIQDILLPAFDNPTLAALTDGAVLDNPGHRQVFTTDSYVVQPLFFSGGDIGSLAVIGTCNDLAMMGAVPRWLSLGLILEESLPLEHLQQVAGSIRRQADAAGVHIVTGDTKVVERGKGDQIYINTAGIGTLALPQPLTPSRIQPGDAILVSNDIGRHGIAVLASREGINLEVETESDLALLHPLIQALLEAGIELHCARDLTRGGLGGALLELAQQSGRGLLVEEAAVPVTDTVSAACELLGFDPLFVANEGCCVLFLPQAQVGAALDILRTYSSARRAARIGSVIEHFQGARLRNAYGVERPFSWHTVDQLPRIC